MPALVFSLSGDIAVDSSDTPLLIDVPGTVAINASVSALFATQEVTAEVFRRGGRFVLATQYLSDRRVARGLALLNNREMLKFDPTDGSTVDFDDAGIVARGRSGKPIFPRIDPAVIGLVHLRGTDKILLGRNRHRSFFSLIAGYIDPGENVEEAFAREVLEETGRRIDNPRYWGSQPFPVGGSLMVGLTASTEDEYPVSETDGELEEIMWVEPAQLSQIPLAPKGSIAHDMLQEVYKRAHNVDLEG